MPYSAKTNRSSLLRSVIVAGMLALPFVGFFAGGFIVELFLAEPDTRLRIGPVAPGKEKISDISWPAGNFTGGQLSMVLDIAVNDTIASDVRVSVDLIDPTDPTRTYSLGQYDKFDVKRGDGLMYSSKIVNLIPVLRNLRGTVRQFDTRKVPLRVKVDRIKKGDRNGFAWVTSANVVGKPIIER